MGADLAPAELLRAGCRKVRVGRLQGGVRGRTFVRQSDGCLSGLVWAGCSSCGFSHLGLATLPRWGWTRCLSAVGPGAGCWQNPWSAGGARTADRAVSEGLVSGTWAACGGMLACAELDGSCSRRAVRVEARTGGPDGRAEARSRLSLLVRLAMQGSSPARPRPGRTGQQPCRCSTRTSASRRRRRTTR